LTNDRNLENSGNLAERSKIDRTARAAAVAVHRAASILSRAGRTAALLGSRWRDLFLPAVLLTASLVALSVDFPISHWVAMGRCPGFIGESLDVVEPFGNGLGVLVILGAILVLDPRRRTAVPRVVAVSLGAGLIANVVKLSVVRIRPCQFQFEGNVWDTFGQFFPLGSAGSAGQSLPSAHTATAVGLAVALCWLYPRGRGFFVAIAALVACQRIQGGNHYVSDTLCGAAVGCLAAILFIRKGPLAAWFDRFEYHLQTLEKPLLEVGNGSPLAGGRPVEPDREVARRPAA
jgi:membrane-associated phospholipid phosphatase